LRIALCGYLGSGCTEIAEILASKFALEIFNTSAVLASIRNLESLSRSGEIDIDMAIKTRLEEALKRDNVIIEGRSAFMFLDRKDMMRIFLNASLEDRVKHVANRRGIPVEAAREDVERSDKDRESLVQRFLRKSRFEATDFDFSINMDSKTFSNIADIIAQVIRMISKQK